MEAGNAIKEGVLKADPDAQVLVKPLADGGEGTTEALSEGLGGELVQVEVHGPMDTPVTAAYGWIRESKTAVMEMAAAAGITLAGKEKQPLHATTYGVGETGMPQFRHRNRRERYQRLRDRYADGAGV